MKLTRRGFLSGLGAATVIAAMPGELLPGAMPTGAPPSVVIPTVVAPEGITYQWIRSSLLGEPDPANIEFRLSKGWTFVTPESHPELSAYQLEEVVETGGLVLMQKPTADVEKARQAEVDAANAQQPPDGDGIIRPPFQKNFGANLKRRLRTQTAWGAL